MPESQKQKRKPSTSTPSIVATNWNKLIHNAIRPAVQSQMRTTQAGRHRAGGSAVHNEWFTTLAELQMQNKHSSSKSKSKSQNQKPVSRKKRAQQKRK